MLIEKSNKLCDGPKNRFFSSFESIDDVITFLYVNSRVRYLSGKAICSSVQ